MRVRLTLFVAFLLATGLFVRYVHAQQKDFAPTEIQKLRLEVKQKNALLAQRDVTDAQTRFNQALSELQDEGKKVETENGWTDVVFSPADLTFKAAPKAAEKK